MARLGSAWVPLMLSAGVIAALFAPAACQTPTQMTVVVSADPATCAALRDFAISVGDDPGATEAKIASGFYATSSSTLRCDGTGVIGTLVLTPSDDSTRGAIVVALGIGETRADSCKPANGYAGCVVARRAFSFREHAKLVLPIQLTFDCLNVPCSAQSSCKNAGCVSSETSCTGDQCATFGVTPDGTPDFVDAATSNDASGPLDGGPGIDAGFDAGDPACGVYNRPLACPPETCVNQPCCTAFTGGSSGSSGTSGFGGTFDGTFRCRASCPTGPSGPSPTPVRIVNCRGSRECAPGFKCCGISPGQQFGGPTPGTTCVPAGQTCPDPSAGYQGTPFLACTADCDCPSGKPCGLATPLPDVRACME
jgi:hypothetical protein